MKYWGNILVILVFSYISYSMLEAMQEAKINSLFLLRSVENKVLRDHQSSKEIS